MIGTEEEEEEEGAGAGAEVPPGRDLIPRKSLLSEVISVRSENEGK